MEKNVFQQEYMPYIVKWGKITCWISIPLVFVPAGIAMAVYGGAPEWGAIITALIGLVSTYGIWYVVDPVCLYPVLQIPGMYLAYVSGQTKEVRSPAAICAMDAAGVAQGTEQGTIIATIGITVSVFVSIAVMTIVAVAGNLILSVLPSAVVTALNFLMPALFGALWMQQILKDVKSAVIIVPIAFVIHFLNTRGVFSVFPLGGGYMQIVLCAIIGLITARNVHRAVLKK